LKTCE
jgi:hypothetical protein